MTIKTRLDAIERILSESGADNEPWCCRHSRTFFFEEGDDEAATIAEYWKAHPEHEYCKKPSFIVRIGIDDSPIKEQDNDY